MNVVLRERSPAVPPTTRDRALEAAVRLVGEQGVRALTHTRVDVEAGLPKGSTSNWFRTRDALMTGVTVWIAEQERADFAARTRPVRTPEQLVEALCEMLDDLTGRDAVRTRARYALFFELTAEHPAASALRDQRSHFEGWMRDVLAGVGAPEPEVAARTLLALSAGLIVNRLTVAPAAPVRPAVEMAVRGCVPR